MKRTAERAIEGLLALNGLTTVAISVGIIFILFSESIVFFEQVSLIDFLTDTQWTPLFTEKRYGILPLLMGTLLTTGIAVATALPLGVASAIYLNEYAGRRFRRVVKPALELLAAVPTVAYGFFALVVVTPLLQRIIPGVSSFNALSAGIVMGIMVIPMISSLSEDALQALPKSLREASYGMGATRWQTAIRVMVPAASSGIIVSVILALSRAIGETMIVAIAAGQQPIFTFDPRKGIETMTAYIVQVSLGDVQHGSLEYKTIYAVGLVLFLFTFLLNNVSYGIRRRYEKR